MATLAETLLQSSLRMSENAGSNVLQGVQVGAKLAQAHQQNKLQQQQLLKAKQEIVSKQYDNIEASFNFLSDLEKKSPKMAKSYAKTILPKKIQANGNLIGPDQLKMMQESEEGRMKATAWILQRRSGAIDDEEFRAAMGRDPELYMSIPHEEIIAAEEAASDRENAENRARIMSKTKVASEDRKFERREKERFTDITRSLGKEVRSKFAKLNDAKAGVKTAMDGFAKLRADMEAGKKPSEINFNAFVRGSAKAFNSGAMTDRDVGDFKSLTGIDNITEDAIRKWIIGGVSFEKVKQLQELTNRMAGTLDARANKLGESFSPQFEMAEFPGRTQEIRKASGIDAFLTPTREYIPEEKRDAPAPPKTFTDKKTGKQRELPDLDLPQVVNALKESVIKAPSQYQALKALAERYGITTDELATKLGL